MSMVGQVLYGFYFIPTSRSEPIDIVINPSGDAVRSLQRCAPPPRILARRMTCSATSSVILAIDTHHV